MVEASSIPLPLSDLTFVLWSDECREYQWNWSAPTEPKLGPILIHHADQKVPGSIDGLPVLGLPYTDSAAMALLRAVNMLVVPCFSIGSLLGLSRLGLHAGSRWARDGTWACFVQWCGFRRVERRLRTGSRVESIYFGSHPGHGLFR